MSSKEIDKLIDRVLQEKEYQIKTKIESFSMIKLSDYKQTFIELVFVILAAGTSAKLAFKTVNILAKDDFVINASLSQIVSKLKECYRFYNVRGKYIFNSRNYIKDEYDNNFEKIFNLNSTHYKRRNFFSSNTKIQGVGMKAASQGGPRPQPGVHSSQLSGRCHPARHGHALHGLRGGDLRAARGL